MRRVINYVMVLTMAVFLSLGVLSLNAMAAEQTQVEYVRTGTLGDNNGISYSYDLRTRTLTVTGEDSGLRWIRESYNPLTGAGYYSPFYPICSGVKTIVVQNCKLSGNVDGLFKELKYLEKIEFNNFDTSDVISMNSMFQYCENLNELDLSSFDTSNVTDMDGMFYGCSRLISLDLSGFDTDKVEYMWDMFAGCQSLTNLNVSNFDTSDVARMDAMFRDCKSLGSLDLSGFDMSDLSMNAKDFLSGCSALEYIRIPEVLHEDYTINLPATFMDEQNNQYTVITQKDANKILTRKVKKLEADAKEITEGSELQLYFTVNGVKQDIEINSQYDWSIDNNVYGSGKITDTGLLEGKYRGRVRIVCVNQEDSTEKYTYDVNVIGLSSNNGECIGWNYDTKTKTLTMSGKGERIDQYIRELDSIERIIVKDCKPVGDLRGAFSYLYNLKEIEFFDFDTSEVTSMRNMFCGCESLEKLDLSSFDTSNVTDMHGMFSDCESLVNLDLSSFDTSNVTNMYGMFSSCHSLLNLDLSGFNTSKVTDMDYMFSTCTNLVNLDLSNFDITNVENMYGMFSSCHSLLNLDLSSFNTSHITNMYYMFNGCMSLKEINLSSFDTSNVTDMTGMFYACRSLEELDLKSFDTSNVTSMDSMFLGCKNIKKLDLSLFKTSNVTSIGSMFYDCSNLEEVKLDNFDTSNVTSMDNMFYACTSLDNLDLSSFNTSSVTSMWNMFYDCKSLSELDLSSFDTSNVNNMTDMFYGCEALECLNLEGFCTNKISTMATMFYGCGSLKNLDLSSFDTSKVTKMNRMFKGCNSLVSINLSGFDTTNVTDMEEMFSGCSSLSELDLSSFFTDKLEDVTDMFKDCNSLKHIDMRNMNISNARNASILFYKCTALESIYTPAKINKKISLPQNYYDAEGNAYNYIVKINCNKLLTTTAPERTVQITSDASEIAVGNSVQLKLVINNNPQDVAVNSSFTWSSSDSKVATVSASGEVKAVGKGTATITATAQDGSGESGNCEITVIEVTIPTGNPFSDIKESSWQYASAKYAYDNGLMAGKGTDANGNIIFDPNKPIPREEFVQVLYNASGKPAVNIENKFPDVKNAWYKNAVLWANANDIANGKGNGDFGVTESISRQDLALMLYKYARMNGYDLTANTGEINKYADGSKVSSYAKTAMDWAITKGVMSGKGTKGEDISTFKLDPTGTATRAECAAMLKNFMEAYGDK